MHEIKDFHKNVFMNDDIIFELYDDVSCVDLVVFSTFDKSKCFKTIVVNKQTEENGKIIHYVSNKSIREVDKIYQVKGEVISFGNGNSLITNNYSVIISSQNSNIVNQSSNITINQDFSKANDSIKKTR